MNKILDEYNKLTGKEQDAFIAWFSGANSEVIMYDGHKRVHMGKAECEWVDFRETWLKKFVDLDWITVKVVREGIAKGLVGHPKYAVYRIEATETGIAVNNAYWDRVNAKLKELRGNHDRSKQVL